MSPRAGPSALHHGFLKKTSRKHLDGPGFVSVAASETSRKCLRGCAVKAAMKQRPGRLSCSSSISPCSSIKESGPSVVKSHATFTMRTQAQVQENNSDWGCVLSSGTSTGASDVTEDLYVIYKKLRNITAFYDWQSECLNDERLLNGTNMILSLPTGAGKTLIAEVVMLREVTLRHRSCILIAPYVAVVQEKVRSLLLFEDTFSVFIEEYAANKGRLPPIKRRVGQSIFVATIEKANLLINSLIEEDRIEDIGVIVVDELHMIGENIRGAVIEQALMKFMLKGVGQIIGMSATLSNVDELTRFLRASVFSTEFRPVRLVEKVKIGTSLYLVSSEGKLEFQVDLGENKLRNRDPEGLVQLLCDVLPKRSVLIFCPTKQNCENVCKMIAHLMPKNVRERRKAERLAALEALREEQDGKLCSLLEMSFLHGVAYHHSGLTADERKIIENAFQEGVINVICCTSTLAAGVNLPARRVIIKAPLVGSEPLRKAQYLQMIGRAGRAGYDNIGEAVTVLHPGYEEAKFLEMISGPLLECNSSLNESEVFSSFLLDLIFLKMAQTKEELEGVVRQTLLGIQNENSAELVRRTLEYLMVHNLLCTDAVRTVLLMTFRIFVFEKLSSVFLQLNFCGLSKCDLQNGKYSTSTLGSAIYFASLPPSVAQKICSSLLDNLNRGIVLSSHFHLIFMVVPFDINVNIDWNIFYDEYKSLPRCEQILVSRLGLNDKQLVKYFVDRPLLKEGETPLRLYISFMLHRLWKQETLYDVAGRFHVSRGWLQSVLQATCSQASSIARFAEKITSLWPLKNLLPDLVQHLRDCSQQELIPLLALDGVKRGRAMQLYNAGFKTIGSIASADSKALLSVIEHLNRRQANAIIRSAKVLLRDQLEEKVEELEQIGVTATEILAKFIATP